MSSRFQAAVLVSAPCYPNAVGWSEENLVAVASGSLVTILNPAKPSGAGSRGVISILPSKPFSIGVINAGGIDFLSGCLLPMHISRDTRPCVRSISWSPAGLASNAGCLLAVCTTGGRVKLYRFPFCDFSAEWIEVMDISEMMYTYFSKINFLESQIIASESLDVIGSPDNADPEGPNEPSVSSLRKERKRRRQNETKVAAKKPNNVKENNTWQIIPVPVSEGTPLKIKECDVPLITAQQYVSRNAMLTPLIVAWSPILRTSGDWVSIPHNSSNCCSILSNGLKCGIISFWRIDAPECYSIINPKLPCKASNVGLLKAHDTGITSICWALSGVGISEPQLLLVTGSSNGRVKIWQVNIKELLKSSETVHTSFSLMREVITIDSAPVSVLSSTVPRQTPLNLLLAIGKGSGSFEVWTMNMPSHEFQIIGCYRAHDHIVTGLAWAFDGRCLYSCSQDNSMKAWILVGETLREIRIPSKNPGLKSSPDVYVYDSCFGLAVSHGSLALVVARRFDSDLLNPMYQERTQKATVEFLWIGGQQLDTSSHICSDIDYGSCAGFPEEELICWEKNILWSLSLCENLSGLLNIWDIVAALLSFKQSIPNLVEQILQKWLTSYFGPNVGICTTFLSTATKILPSLTSRKLHLINIITRHVVLKNDEVSESRKRQDLESFSSAIEEQTNIWKELQLCCENELRKRLVGVSFSVTLSLLSDVPTNFCDVGCWRPDECPQLEQWISLHEKIVEDELKFLAVEVGKIKKSRRESFEYEEHCSFCSATVPFESTEYAVCLGVKSDNGVDQTHNLNRCSVSMQLCPSKYSWFCMCCQRRASKLAPLILFMMPLYPYNFKSLLESSAFTKSFSPCCPLCGILLQRLQPEYLLSTSPV